MNILILNSAKSWGGNEKWSLMAANALSERHNVYVAYQSDVYGNRFKAPKAKLLFLAEIDPLTIIALIGLIRRYKIDVLLPTKRKDYVLAGIASKLAGKKNILRLGIVRDLGERFFNNLVYHKLADGIIVNAKQIKNVLLGSSFMKAQNIRVIYNGLDVKKLREQAAAKTFPKPFEFVVSSMGTLNERKGFDFLIRGFAHFLTLSNADNAGLMIIGEGPKYEELQKLTQNLGIAQKVIFTGFLENPYPCIAVSDAFAMTSNNEGFANALLEGIALGNAPVTTQAGGVQEVLCHEKSALMVEFNDSKTLGEHIYRLYKNPSEKHALHMEAFKVIQDVFSVQTMTTELEQFLADVVQGEKNH